MNGQAQVETLLASYPRRRPELPQAHREIYVEHYRRNRAGAHGLSRIVKSLESWMHRSIERETSSGSVLDIGAGNLNHLPYHSGGGVYDAVEPFRELWQESPYRQRVRHIYEDVADIPAEQQYACILSVAVLEHLTDLPAVLASSANRLQPGGTFRAGFPSEGGLLWGLAWRLTTGIEFRLRRGLDYGAIVRYEHVNTAAEIIAVLHYFFKHVDISRFPLPASHLSFYTTAIAREPMLDRCYRFLATRATVQESQR